MSLVEEYITNYIKLNLGTKTERQIKKELGFPHSRTVARIIEKVKEEVDVFEVLYSLTDTSDETISGLIRIAEQEKRVNVRSWAKSRLEEIFKADRKYANPNYMLRQSKLTENKFNTLKRILEMKEQGKTAYAASVETGKSLTYTYGIYNGKSPLLDAFHKLNT